MFLLLLITFIYIYFLFGLFVLAQTVLLTIVFLLSNLLIGINPFNKEMHVIRISSIILIITLLYYNSTQISISTALILPLSISKISYFDDIFQKEVLIDKNSITETIHLINIDKISDFLVKLDTNYNYVGLIEFVPDYLIFEEDSPKMILCNPFLFNKFSSSTVITKFINERLDLMTDKFYLLLLSLLKLINYSLFNTIYYFYLATLDP